MPRTLIALLALILVLGMVRPLPAAPPQYTIAQLYSAAKRAPAIMGGKSFAGHAVIISPSYRVECGEFRQYYFHPEYGQQIKALLEQDVFVNWGQIDRFVRRNLARIHHVSLYEEGFILMQLEKPQEVLIIPVSLVTVRKSEQVVRSYLKLQR